MDKHPIARVPTLAAIEEASITAALTKVEDRPKVTDIFPNQELSDHEPTSEPSETDQEKGMPTQKKPSSNRLRTISESQQSRFQVSSCVLHTVVCISESK